MEHDRSSTHQSTSRIATIEPAAVPERLQRRLAPSATPPATSAPAPLPSSGFAVQLFADAMNAGVNPAEHVGRAAAHGLSGASGALPHLAAIQQAFGRHDVSTVQAHVGGRAAEGAAAMGAHGFAAGNAVAFAAAPDLHLAAHEAAHVVQQRAGVHLKGGVGEAGDRYERHADAVADLVVQGRSAESVLDQLAPAGAPASGGGVQRFAIQMDETDTGPVLPAAGDGDARPARSPDAERRLTAAIVQAIAMNETGGREQAIESRMGTSSGVAASYASATQMVASHATGTLRRAPGVAAEHGLDRRELRDADRIMRAAQRIWDAVVLHSVAFASLDRADVALTHFTEEDVAQMARMGRFRARLLAERSRFEHPRGRRRDVAVALARELASDADVVAMGLSEADVLAYVHDGRMNRFAEDRNSWNRVALSRTNEHTAVDGAAPRTLESAIEGAAEAGHGWSLSSVDFGRMVHAFLAGHPAATDEQVVRHCAAHNGHSSDYPDRIWGHFQRLHAAG